MAQLLEYSRVEPKTGQAQLIIMDYDQHPKLCRRGIWVGWLVEMRETVILSYEHDPEELYVGWSINGATVIDPGYSSGTLYPAPAPGEPSVSYQCPVNNLFHRISLASSPGHTEVCLGVQVLYRSPLESAYPAHPGPLMRVCLSGSRIDWPTDKLQEEQNCLKRYRHLLDKYVQVQHVGPGDPVERWLARLRGDEAIRLRAELETLEKLDRKVDRQLSDAIVSDLIRTVQWAKMPGAAVAPGDEPHPGQGPSPAAD
jgi:hypothetical protein